MRCHFRVPIVAALLTMLPGLASCLQGDTLSPKTTRSPDPTTVDDVAALAPTPVVTAAALFESLVGREQPVQLIPSGCGFYGNSLNFDWLACATRPQCYVADASTAGAYFGCYPPEPSSIFHISTIRTKCVGSAQATGPFNSNTLSCTGTIVTTFRTTDSITTTLVSNVTSTLRMTACWTYYLEFQSARTATGFECWPFAGADILTTNTIVSSTRYTVVVPLLTLASPDSSTSASMVTSATTTVAPTPTSQTSGESTAVSPGLIGGIAGGGAVVIILVGVVIWLLLRSRNKAKAGVAAAPHESAPLQAGGHSSMVFSSPSLPGSAMPSPTYGPIMHRYYPTQSLDGKSVVSGTTYVAQLDDSRPDTVSPPPAGFAHLSVGGFQAANGGRTDGVGHSPSKSGFSELGSF